MRRFVDRHADEKEDGCHDGDRNDRGIADGGGVDTALEGGRAVETDSAHAGENQHSCHRGAEDFPWTDTAEGKGEAQHRQARDEQEQHEEQGRNKLAPPDLRRG